MPRTFARYAFAAVPLALVAALTAEAHADPEPRFGKAGQLVFTDALQIYGNFTTYAKDSTSQKAIAVEPGFDYFVVDHVALGVSSNITWYDDKLYDGSGNLVESTGLSFDLGLRLSVEVPLGERFSLMPRARLAYGTQKYTTSTVGAPDSNPPTKWGDDFLYLSVYVPLIVHVVPHFFLGIGPSAGTSLMFKSGDNPSADGNRGTTFGFGSIVGGWF